jgi:hypothetical protein
VADLASGSISAYDLDAHIAQVAVDADQGLVIVLTADGVLSLIDPLSGEILASNQLLGSAQSEAGSPVVVIGGARAYVSDPEVRVIFEVAVNDGLRLGRTFEVDVTPGSLAFLEG